MLRTRNDVTRCLQHMAVEIIRKQKPIQDRYPYRYSLGQGLSCNKTISHDSPKEQAKSYIGHTLPSPRRINNNASMRLIRPFFYTMTKEYLPSRPLHNIQNLQIQPPQTEPPLPKMPISRLEVSTPRFLKRRNVPASASLISDQGQSVCVRDLHNEVGIALD